LTWLHSLSTQTDVLAACHSCRPAARLPPPPVPSKVPVAWNSCFFVSTELSRELKRQHPCVPSANVATVCHRCLKLSSWLLLFRKPPPAIYEPISSVFNGLMTSHEENQMRIDLSPMLSAPLPKIAASHHPIASNGAHSVGVSHLNFSHLHPFSYTVVQAQRRPPSICRRCSSTLHYVGPSPAFKWFQLPPTMSSWR
jgi:hypothetical protein